MHIPVIITWQESNISADFESLWTGFRRGISAVNRLTAGIYKSEYNRELRSVQLFLHWIRSDLDEMSRGKSSQTSDLGSHALTTVHIPGYSSVIPNQSNVVLGNRLINSCAESSYYSYSNSVQATSSTTTIMPPVATFEAQFLDPQTIEQIDITWEMARASFESNNNQILINPNIYHKIGAAGVEELKFRLR